MLYGHAETYEERVDHLLRLRDQQDRTGGFLAFIPLAHAFVILALIIYGHAARKLWNVTMPTRLAGANIGLMAIAWLLGVPSAAFVCAGLTVLFAGIGFVQYYRTVRTNLC